MVTGCTLRGAALAARGHTVADVLAWSRVLRHPWRWRRSSLPAVAMEALCDGWVDGALIGAAPPGSTGVLAPLAVLAHRARQHHQRAAPAVPLAIVVVVLDEDALRGNEVALGDHVRAAFGGGETLARGRRGPVLILTPRLPSLAARTRALIESLTADAVLGAVAPRVWVEPLGSSASSIDAHIRCITG